MRINNVSVLTRLIRSNEHGFEFEDKNHDLRVLLDRDINDQNE